jgi:NAD(P)-dependent dehydrogenase (short-subunit alcohol dehydrogenase family)
MSAAAKSEASMWQRVAGPTGPLNLRDKTALLVGATSGIGEAMAHQLAAAGARLIIAGRDSGKLARLAAALRSKASEPVQTVRVDLADLGSVAAAAKEIHERVAAIHVLIANAGVLYMGNERQLTRDGFELTMGVNHLGNAALILALQDQMRNAAPARIVVVASEAHRRAGNAPFDDLMGERNFSGLRAYSRSKLANILFARELARRLQSAGVTVYAAHPGVVDTPILNAFARTRFDRAGLRVARLLFLAPDKAARGILRVAADPTMKEPSGSYFELGKPNRGSRLSNDRLLAQQLWEMTERLLKGSASGVGSDAAEWG